MEEGVMDAATYEKRAKEMAAAIESMVDTTLHSISEKLNERRLRVVDLFRKIDKTQKGSVTAEEFCDGLLWMGFEPTDKEFECLIQRLDKHGIGLVTLKDLDRGLKAVERKFPEKKRTPRKKIAEAKTLQLPPPESKLPLVLGPLDSTDEVMLKIIGQMNVRKYRSIDFFRTIDLDSSGTVSVEEFSQGLKKLGVQPSAKEFEALTSRLDKDGSGDITGAEFDKLVKLVIKKTKADGREAELETWPLKRPLKDESSSFSWSSRSLCTTSNWSMTDTSARLPTPWSAANTGPRGIAWSSLIGSGSIYDTSIQRERFFDASLSGAHTTSLKMPKLPLHKTVYKRSVYVGRFENEPTNLPSPRMLRTKDTCDVSVRGRFKSIPYGSVRTFHQSPMMQSTVDEVVFNRDMDQSGGSKFDDEFIAMFQGFAGLPSWHNSKE